VESSPPEEGHEKLRSPRLFARLADSYREKGDLDKAIEVLRRGLEDNPNYITARIILAACFTDKGEYNEALGEYEHILKLDPFHTAAAKKLGLLLVYMGRPEEAKVFIENYLEEVPDDTDMSSLLLKLEDDASQDRTEISENTGQKAETFDTEVEESLQQTEAPDGSIVEPDQEIEKPDQEEKENNQEAKAPDQDIVEPDRVEETAAQEMDEPDQEAYEPEQEMQEQDPEENSEDKETEEPEQSLEVENVTEDQEQQNKQIPGQESELIATMTLAEIYASQGFYEKAIDIYQKVLSREPSNEIARKRIEAIKKGEIREESDGVTLEKSGENAGEIGEDVDWSSGGVPGEVVIDEEYEKFKKWLGDLTKKKDVKDNRR
jgi:tetratricopeptide (TPR) repeat protein